MKQTLYQRKKVFLKEYEKLCKQHGFQIEGCGCCGSPFLVSLTKKQKEDGKIAIVKNMKTFL